MQHRCDPAKAMGLRDYSCSLAAVFDDTAFFKLHSIRYRSYYVPAA